MPKTPDSFPGVRVDEGILLTDDGYGVPGTQGEIRFSGGHLFIRDGYEAFNVRTYVQSHISSHLGDGSDTFYVISPSAPTAYEDVNDGYEVGFRWINTTDGYEYVLIDNSPGAADWKQTTISSTTSVVPLFFDGYDTSGGTNISSGWTDVPLDGERIKDNAFSHTGSSAEVTINTSGTYLVFARVGTDISSGTSRSKSEMRMMLDSGSGYSEVPGSRGLMYNRTSSQGGTHASVALVLSFSVGDKIKIQAQRISGSSTVVLEPNNSGLVIASSTGSGSGTGTDELVKVSDNDTTADYLENKIVGDGYVSVTTLNDGGDEDLQISVDLDGYLDETKHETLDTLTHEVVENSYDEATYSGSKITNLTVYTDATKTTKIREEQVSYSGSKITQFITIQYNSVGVESYRITEDITYQGNKIKTITRTRS